MAKRTKVKFGQTDLLPKCDPDSKNTKVRISILIEGDLLQAYKEAAKLTPHGEYQTLMKEKLREGLNRGATRRFSEEEVEFLKARLRPAFIEIVDEEIEERIPPKARKGA